MNSKHYSLEELKLELQRMKPRSQLYELIKKEMQRRGRWKAKERGKSFNKGYDRRRQGLEPEETA